MPVTVEPVEQAPAAVAQQLEPMVQEEVQAVLVEPVTKVVQPYSMFAQHHQFFIISRPMEKMVRHLREETVQAVQERAPYMCWIISGFPVTVEAQEWLVLPEAVVTVAHT